MTSVIRANIWQNSAGVVRQTVLNTYAFESFAAVTDNTGSFVTTPFTITLTPTSATSRFALWFSAWGQVSTNVTHGVATFYRNNTTNLGGSYGFGNFYTSSGGYTEFYIGINYVDSPATTSAITYTIFIRKEGAGSFSLGSTVRKSSFIIQEIAI
jgi:hypothetical protein